jgi:hypothetical protein
METDGTRKAGTNSGSSLKCSLLVSWSKT